MTVNETISEINRLYGPETRRIFIKHIGLLNKSTVDDIRDGTFEEDTKKATDFVIERPDITIAHRVRSLWLPVKDLSIRTLTGYGNLSEWHKLKGGHADFSFYGTSDSKVIEESTKFAHYAIWDVGAARRNGFFDIDYHKYERETKSTGAFAAYIPLDLFIEYDCLLVSEYL
jgi:hypothetical protein